MRYNNEYYGHADNEPPIRNRWLKFIFGLFILVGMIFFFASGYTPPGVCGEVLRHNQEYNIDASPIFYGDVENMSEYEDGIRLKHKKAMTEPE